MSRGGGARSTLLVRALTAALLAVGMVAGVASCSVIGGNSSVPVATAKPPTGTDGAVDFDGRFLTVGSGAKHVDLWFDPMCPVCGAFEKANGKTIAAAVSDDSITLRLHPLTFLDRSSNGTAYSTRAVAALTCVGVREPNSVLAYYESLFAHQPDEGSDGLTDKQLAGLATDLGLTGIDSCISRDAPYQAWAQANTAASQTGPITVDGKKVLDRIEGTPTVLVDGKQYSGNIGDGAAFRSFLSTK
jgi:protein-disulfide isomerase